MALDISRLPLVRGVQSCADFSSQASTVCLQELLVLKGACGANRTQFLQMLGEDGFISYR